MAIHDLPLQVHFQKAEPGYDHQKGNSKKNVLLLVQEPGNKQVIGNVDHESKVYHFQAGDQPACIAGIILVTEKMPAAK